MKKALALLCLAVLLTAWLLPLAALAGSQTMYVVTGNRGTLNVRSAPDASTNTNIIGRISYGTAVTVLQTQYNGSWALIRPNNWTRTGYVLMEFLSYNNPQGGGGSSGSLIDSDYVSEIFTNFVLINGVYTVYARPDRTSGWVNLRWAPSTKAAVQAQCYNGYALRVLAENRYWYQVEDSSSGYTGFILKQYTTSGGYGSSYDYDY